MPGDQVEQHCTERIHITRSHGGLAHNLFRRCVFQREAAARELREVRRRFIDARFVERCGNTEVKQFHRAVGRHHHVRGFQIAVQHELAVCVLNRARNVTHQAHSVL